MVEELSYPGHDFSSNEDYTVVIVRTCKLSPFGVPVMAEPCGGCHNFVDGVGQTPLNVLVLGCVLVASRPFAVSTIISPSIQKDWQMMTYHVR